ncbi:MAG TPA: 23S rRNA (guanosine(2251)-2'-O)-methyltransferase RlmB [Bacteroidia bacterium]|nr:23S rRNA (guanosine(2251)-2'-O)-methyltransferase RlmB [Bacteroidia bacterium]
MKKETHLSDDTLVYGIHAVSEAIRAGKEFDKLFIQDGLKGDLFSALKPLIREAGIFCQFVPVQKLNKITGGKNHQGVAGFLSQIGYHSIGQVVPSLFESGETPLVLILDRITDVRNFGAIARTAECAGAGAIVIPSRGAAQVNADAVKTSAGALHKIPVCREDNLKETIEYLKQSGFRIAACTEKASQPLYEADLTGPLAVIMGSEEDGISPEYLKRSDVRIQIPMRGTISSLNVSVAAGIVLFEVLRQRRA